MFDLAGNVIGINSALISPTGASVGIGLAIPAEAGQAGDRLAAPRPAPAARLSRRRPPAARREYRRLARPAQGPGRNRPLGRPRRGRGARRDPAGRRHRPRQRPAGHPDQTVSYLIANTTVGSRVPLDIIRDGRRQTRHRRRSASARPRKQLARAGRRRRRQPRRWPRKPRSRRAPRSACRCRR